MNATELAEKLDGAKYRDEVSAELRHEAQESNLVIVYGLSDDLIEFDGLITEELDRWEGGPCYINRKMKVSNYYIKKGSKINAIWNPKDSNLRWIFKTKIPHSTFYITEDGEKVCRGIVFSIDDLK